MPTKIRIWDSLAPSMTTAGEVKNFVGAVAALVGPLLCCEYVNAILAVMVPQSRYGQLKMCAIIIVFCLSRRRQSL
jgi:hypothetical protein